jgi:hypothetical protein
MVSKNSPAGHSHSFLEMTRFQSIESVFFSNKLYYHFHYKKLSYRLYINTKENLCFVIHCLHSHYYYFPSLYSLPLATWLPLANETIEYKTEAET